MCEANFTQDSDLKTHFAKVHESKKDSLNEKDLDNEGIDSVNKTQWSFANEGEFLEYDTIKATRHSKSQGPRVEINLLGDVSMMQWHHKGDYIGVVAPIQGGKQAKAISIHQIFTRVILVIIFLSH